MKATTRAVHAPPRGMTAMMGTLSMIVTLFALLVLSSPLRAYGSDDTGAKAPSVEVSEMKYDFGFAVDGEKITHDFVLKNTGTDILEIHKVQTA